MRHRKAGIKLNRTPSHREAMFRNMVTSLFKYERIRTTGAKAKELRRWADHIITLAKRGDLHARRQALAIVREKDVVHKLFENADERFGAVSGGYTRIVKLGRRPGDAAPISMVELIVSEDTKKKKKKKKKAKSEAAPQKAAKPEAAPEAKEEKAAVKAEAADKDKASKEEKPAAKGGAKKEAKADAAKDAEKKETAEAKKEAQPKKEAKSTSKTKAAAKKEELADTDEKKSTPKDEGK